MRPIKKHQSGFTLVELMIVVAIVGILAALAIYGVRKYMLNAKTAEARNSLGQMAKDASAAYAREGMSAQVLSLGSSTGIVNHLCGNAAAVPSSSDSIQGKKYQSTPTDWTTNPDANGNLMGWTCLKFSMQDPQYFQYNYTLSAGDGLAPGSQFTAQAQGDLDGNKVLSNFTLMGQISQDTTSKALVVTIAPNIGEVNPDE